MLASGRFAFAKTSASASTAARHSGPLAVAWTGTTCCWAFEGFRPRRYSASRRRSAQRPMRRWLRHKSDTIDFLQCGFAGIDEPEGGVAERHRARGTRGFLQLARRSARGDQLTKLVVQHEQLADRFSSLEPSASALGTTLGLALLAENPDQPLRQYAVQRRDQVVAVHAHVLEAP